MLHIPAEVKIKGRARRLTKHKEIADILSHASSVQLLRAYSCVSATQTNAAIGMLEKQDPEETIKFMLFCMSGLGVMIEEALCARLGVPVKSVSSRRGRAADSEFMDNLYELVYEV